MASQLRSYSIYAAYGDSGSPLAPRSLQFLFLSALLEAWIFNKEVDLICVRGTDSSRQYEFLNAIMFSLSSYSHAFYTNTSAESASRTREIYILVEP